ncbi:MAG: phosphoribosyltransferase family protein [Bacilli bacterium]
MKLLGEKSTRYKEEISKLTWDEFEELADIIADHIIYNKLNLQKVCLLGTARGALPLLTYISHQTGIRDISVMQLKMTNSDKPFDYGNVKVLLKAIRLDFDKFIVLEDIIYKGQTINIIQDELQKYGKEILEIYSLVIDEAYSNKNINLKVKAASVIKKDKWVVFPWEKKIEVSEYIVASKKSSKVSR